LITTDDELAKKWGNYFRELLNCEEPEETFIFDLANRDIIDCTEPTLDKVKNQINNLKNHKSPEEDEIQAEFLKKEENKSHLEFGN